jgi:5-methylcytosine-specific restriction enzyme subunit McrC
MIANNGIIQILEFQRLYINDKNITQEVFNSLENFILESDMPFLILKSDKGKKYIHAQCYVGVIKLKNGFTIEILPKITGLENNIEKSKEVLIKMINSLQNTELNLNSSREIYSLNKNFSVYINEKIEFAILFDMNI